MARQMDKCALKIEIKPQRNASPNPSKLGRNVKASLSRRKEPSFHDVPRRTCAAPAESAASAPRVLLVVASGSPAARKHGGSFDGRPDETRRDETRRDETRQDSTISTRAGDTNV